MRTSLLLSLAFLIIVSCNDDDDDLPTVEVTDIEIVTGIALTDVNGQGFGAVGNPNNYGDLVLFPNPPEDVQTAILTSNENIVSLELVPAEKNGEFSEIEVSAAFDQFEGYPEDEIQALTSRSLTSSQPLASFRYQLDGLAPGYYRVIATDEAGAQHGSAIFIDSTLSFPGEIRDTLLANCP